MLYYRKIIIQKSGFLYFMDFLLVYLLLQELANILEELLVFKNHSLLRVTLATLLDKLFLLLLVAFFGSISSILFIHYYYHVTFYLTAGLFLLVFTLFYLFFWMIFNDRFWDNVLFTKLRDSIKLHWLFEKVKVFRKLDKKYATKMLFISFVFYLCFLVQYAVLVAAFSNHT